jgi:hypothetical protein
MRQRGAGDASGHAPPPLGRPAQRAEPAGPRDDGGESKDGAGVVRRRPIDAFFVGEAGGRPGFGIDQNPTFKPTLNVCNVLEFRKL